MKTDSRMPIRLNSDTFVPALDHLTVTDSTPSQLAQLAYANGFRAICLFMESMAVLPQMPSFSLYDSPTNRRELRRILDDSGLALDVAYPFTLTRRSGMADFERGLACAADLGARFVNLLIYDREEQGRRDRFASFCELANGHGLDVVLEFYPGSAVRCLADGLDMVSNLGRRGRVGLNVDLLHLVRSGGSAEELKAAPADYILYGQLCDGMIACEASEREYEASSQRVLPGDGQFDLNAFVGALPSGCLTSIETPQEASIVAGVLPDDRARIAMASLETALVGR